MNTPFTTETLDEFITQPQPCVLKTAKTLHGDALVLGAAGKMGFHLCLMLKRSFEHNGQNNRVIAVSRFSSPGSQNQFEEHGIKTISCDLSDEEQLAALPDAENIWFMAGVKFGTSDHPELLHQMNVEMPKQVARRFKKSRIAALSTGCVYSFVPTDSAGSSESDATESDSRYAESCRGRERSFRSISETEGLRSVLIRLNYSVEMRYGVLVDIAQKVFRQTPIDISMSHFNCIWQGDAIAHIISAVSLAQSPSAVLNVTGSQKLSIRKTAETFGKLFDKEPILVGVEQQTAWLNNPDKAIRLFGPPKTSPEQMIEWIAEWLKNDGETLGKPTKFEVRNGKF